jgi:hypothetical protein
MIVGGSNPLSFGDIMSSKHIETFMPYLVVKKWEWVQCFKRYHQWKLPLILLDIFEVMSIFGFM